jgi:hypothetical protein
MKWLVVLVLFASVVFVTVYVFERPVGAKAPCYQQIKDYYHDTDYIFKLTYGTERDVCERRKEAVLTMYQCFHQADITVTNISKEPELTSLAAKLITRSPSDMDGTLEQFEEWCGQRGVHISQKELDKAISQLP